MLRSSDLRAIAVLPGTALIIVPALLLWLARDTFWGGHFVPWSGPLFWLALAVGAAGLALFIWTVWLFRRRGEGTLAPWDPPKRLVVSGPYRHVRNPMIAGVLFMLLAEAVLFNSLAVFLWALVFFLANTLWFALYEEPSLARRFGDDYLRYKAHVRRWLPRATPWLGGPAPD